MPRKRELLKTPSGNRFITRGPDGKFLPGQVEVGASLAQDNNKEAKKNTPSGFGNRGDHRPSRKKK